MRLTRKQKTEAVKDYMSTRDNLKDVAARNGMSYETLRRLVGSTRIKKRRKSEGASETTGQMKMFGERANKGWTQEEVSLLIDCVKDGLSLEESAELLGRTKFAVTCKKSLLKTQEGIDVFEKRFPTIHEQRGDSLDLADINKILEVTEDQLCGPSKENPVVVEKTDSMPLSDIGRVGISELAKMVKEYGVRVKICVTEGGTQVHLEK